MDARALWLCSYGLYVVSSKKGDKLNGQIVNTVFQVTAEPPTIVVSINKSNLTHEFISASKVFSASILSTEAPMPFIGKFGFKSGREIDKFKDTNYKAGVTGAPIVTDYALAFIEADVISTLDVGTHTIFVGRVADCGVLKPGEPMTYAYYHQVKKGRTPKAAATYQKEQTTSARPAPMAAAAGPAPTAAGPAVSKPESQPTGKANALTEDKKMRKYRCTVCGYIYDPIAGDPDGGVKPGTAFEDIPDDWACPVCGVSKDQFEPADQ